MEVQQDPNSDKTPGQIELELRRLEFLKEYANDTNRSPDSVGKELDLNSKTAYNHIKWLCAISATAQNEGVFPAKVLHYYNECLKGTDEEGDPNAALTEDELNTLAELMPTYGQDTMQALTLKEHGIVPAGAEAAGKGENAGGQYYQEGNAGTTHINQKNVSNDGYPRMSSNIFEGANGITHESILEGLLRNVGQASPNMIRQIMAAFIPQKQIYISYPPKMESFLRAWFSLVKAKALTEQYFDALPMQLPGFAYQNPYSVGQQGFGMQGYYPQQQQMGYGQPQPGMMPGMGQSMMPPGMPPMQPTGDPSWDAWVRQEAWKEWYEERKEAKEAKRQERMMQTGWQAQMAKLMEKSTNDNSMERMLPFMMGGRMTVRERMGPEGQPIREYVPTAGGEGGESGTIGPLLNFMSNMNTNLLKNQTEGPKLLESLVTTMFNRWNDNNNVFDAIKKITEMSNLMGGNKNAESLDTVQAKLDTKLAMWHEEMRWREKKHEWESSSEEQERAERQQKEFVGTLRDLGKDVIAPVLNRFAQGYLARQQGGAPGPGGPQPQGVPMNQYQRPEYDNPPPPYPPQPQPQYYQPQQQQQQQQPPYPQYMQQMQQQPQEQPQQQQHQHTSQMPGPTEYLNLDDEQIDKLLGDIDQGESRLETAKAQLRSEKSRRQIAKTRITQTPATKRQESIPEEEDRDFAPSTRTMTPSEPEQPATHAADGEDFGVGDQPSPEGPA